MNSRRRKRPRPQRLSSRGGCKRDTRFPGGSHARHGRRPARAHGFCARARGGTRCGWKCVSASSSGGYSSCCALWWWSGARGGRRRPKGVYRTALFYQEIHFKALIITVQPIRVVLTPKCVSVSLRFLVCPTFTLSCFFWRCSCSRLVLVQSWVPYSIILPGSKCTLGVNTSTLRLQVFR